MSYERHREAQIIDRCWSVYNLLTSAFSPPDTFHLDFPSLVETAFMSMAQSHQYQPVLPRSRRQLPSQWPYRHQVEVSQVLQHPGCSQWLRLSRRPFLWPVYPAVCRMRLQVQIYKGMIPRNRYFHSLLHQFYCYNHCHKLWGSTL